MKHCLFSNNWLNFFLELVFQKMVWITVRIVSGTPYKLNWLSKIFKWFLFPSCWCKVLQTAIYWRIQRLEKFADFLSILRCRIFPANRNCFPSSSPCLLGSYLSQSLWWEYLSPSCGHMLCATFIFFCSGFPSRRLFNPAHLHALHFHAFFDTIIVRFDCREYWLRIVAKEFSLSFRVQAFFFTEL